MLHSSTIESTVKSTIRWPGARLPCEATEPVWWIANVTPNPRLSSQ